MSDESNEKVFVRFAVTLKENERAAIRDAAVRVSDPRSERYGQYLSRDQLRRLSRPNAEAMARAKQWFRDQKLAVFDGLFETDAPQTFAAFGFLSSKLKEAFPGWDDRRTVVSHGDWHLPGD